MTTPLITGEESWLETPAGRSWKAAFAGCPEPFRWAPEQVASAILKAHEIVAAEAGRGRRGAAFRARDTRGRRVKAALHQRIKKGRHSGRPKSNRRKRPEGSPRHRLDTSMEAEVPAMLKWNPQQDDLLRRLCADKALSYGDIAKILTQKWGRTVSRSAVGQRSRRQGFREKTARQYTTGAERPAVPQSPAAPRAPTEPPRFARRLDFPDPEPNAPGILILNASEKDCRFPIQGRGLNLRVCGEPRAIGSYCEHCAKLAYTPEGRRNGGTGFTLKSASEARAWREKNTPVARLAVAV